MNDSLPERLTPLQALKRRFRKSREGEAIIRRRYRQYFGRELDTASPQRFSEKLYARMILAHQNKYRAFTRLSDKYLVRAYVSSKIGERYLTKLLWSGKDPKRIPFSNMPHDYIIKTNHGSGSNIVVRGVPDTDAIIGKLSHWLDNNYYWDDREHQYYGIKPRILIEELLEDGMPDGPYDYRFWCFDGEPVLIQVDNHSHSINPFYDSNWSKTSVSYRAKFEDADIEKPANFEEMICVARRLAAPFDFVRVDLYNPDNRIVFGELTFTPVGGRLAIKPEEWDAMLGKIWNFRVY